MTLPDSIINLDSLRSGWPGRFAPLPRTKREFGPFCGLNLFTPGLVYILLFLTLIDGMTVRV